MTKTTNHLAERAMLANVSISQWSGRKLDRKVTDDANKAANAKADAGRYNKLLLPAEAFKPITTAVSAARDEHMRRTLPWSDAGPRILMAVGYDDYAKAMKVHHDDFDAAVRKFVADYPAYLASAPDRLGDMFDPEDYPAADDVANRFAFRFEISSVPEGKDFRASVSDSQAARIREEIEARAQEAIDRAARDVWQRVADVAGHMVERLRAFKPGERTGVFRDTLVGNISDLVAVLPALNVKADPALDAIAARLKDELCDVPPDTLRISETARNRVADKAEAILKDVSAYLA